MRVSKLVFGKLLTGASAFGSLPASTSQEATSVAPFQLA